MELDKVPKPDMRPQVGARGGETVDISLEQSKGGGGGGEEKKREDECESVVRQSK